MEDQPKEDGCSSEADAEGGGYNGAEKKMKGKTVILFLAKGIFHIEAAMISNPSCSNAQR